MEGGSIPFSVLDKMRTEEEKAWLLVEDEDDWCSSSSTSSIGKDSDVSKCDDIDDENEAQSVYKCDEPLNMMDSLQHFLPIRKGISKFYDGKSKSFKSLANAVSSPSVKDIAKPENTYTRRRRNLMVFNHLWENRKFFLRSNNGGISERTVSLNQSTVALAFAMNCDSSSSCSSEESTSSSNPRSPPSLRQNRVSSESSSTNSSI